MKGLLFALLMVFASAQVLFPVNSLYSGCVKASQINDRKFTRIELIRLNLRSLRSLISESFHASPSVRNLQERALTFAERDTGTLAKMEKKLETYPSYDYPYENSLPILEQKKLLIFSYGSLMNKKSAMRTLGRDALASFEPAIAIGLQRVFDRDVPIRANSRWKSPCDPMARGMLNVAIFPGGFINGILFQVEKKDISQLLKREEGYDLIPVIVISFKDWQKKRSSYTIAYTFHAKQDSNYTDRNILPRPLYYEFVRNTAKDYGQGFEKLWFSTTFFADGTTPISSWEKAVQAKKRFTQVECR